MTINRIQYRCQSSELERLACRTPWHLLGHVYNRPRHGYRTANTPFEGRIQHVRWLKQDPTWAISVGGKNRGLMRSVVGNSEGDCAGVVEVQQTEKLAAAATVTEVKAGKVPMLESLAHWHSRMGRRLRQTVDHPERDR